MAPHEKKFEAPLPGGAVEEKNSEYSAYDQFADKVGFVPNLRKDDNKLQAKVFLLTWALCIAAGFIIGRTDGAMMGALLGTVVALLVSGGVLTVVGLLRK